MRETLSSPRVGRTTRRKHLGWIKILKDNWSLDDLDDLDIDDDAQFDRDDDLEAPGPVSAIALLQKPQPPEFPERKDRNPYGTRESAKAQLRSTIAAFNTKVEQAAHRWHMSASQDEIWLRVHGDRPRHTNILASNARTRERLGCAFIDMMADMFDAHAARRYFLMSIIHDGWRTYDRDTHIDLLDIQRRGHQVLRQIGIPALAVIEIQAAVNAVAGKGRMLLPHIHAIGWTDDRRFRASTVSSNLCASRRLVAVRGNPTVTIEKIDPTLGDLLHASGYLIKDPAEGKDFVPPSKQHPNGHVYTRTDSVRPNLLLRVDEVLSRLRFNELLFGHNCRDEIGHMRRVLSDVERGRYFSPVPDRRVRNMWRGGRSRNRKADYGPVLITRR